jgi:hypothetical protein
MIDRCGGDRLRRRLGLLRRLVGLLGGRLVDGFGDLTQHEFGRIAGHRLLSRLVLRRTGRLVGHGQFSGLGLVAGESRFFGRRLVTGAGGSAELEPRRFLGSRLLGSPSLLKRSLPGRRVLRRWVVGCWLVGVGSGTSGRLFGGFFGLRLVRGFCGLTQYQLCRVTRRRAGGLRLFGLARGFGWLPQDELCRVTRHGLRLVVFCRPGSRRPVHIGRLGVGWFGVGSWVRHSFGVVLGGGFAVVVARFVLFSGVFRL